MRCKKCDYSLWNLTGDTCPECGNKYSPSDYQFVVGSVKYLCSHCDQKYYGTTANGHLDPIEFDCISCGKHIHMDLMRLQVEDGWEESLTTIRIAPWVNGRFGIVRRCLYTIGWSMVRQIDLMKGLPATVGFASSSWFFIVFMIPTLLVGFVVPVSILGLIIFNSGGGMAATFWPFVFGSLGSFAGVLFGTYLLALLWAVMTHGILVVTGGSNQPLSRTFAAIVFASGPLAASAVPCVGFYCISYISFIWWIVSAALMVWTCHRISGFRASLAVVLPPILLVIVGFSLYVGAIFYLNPTMRAGPAFVPRLTNGSSSPFRSDAMTTVGTRLGELRTDLGEGRKRWPNSVTDLDWGRGHSTDDLITLMNDGDYMAKVVPGKDGFMFNSLSGEPLDRALQQLYSSAGTGPGHERLGDLFYLLPNVEFDSSDPRLAGSDDLWLLVVVVYDPTWFEFSFMACEVDPSGASGDVNIIEMDAVEVSAMDSIKQAIAEQDVLRAEHGLPPISDALLGYIEQQLSDGNQP